MGTLTSRGTEAFCDDGGSHERRWLDGGADGLLVLNCGKEKREEEISDCCPLLELLLLLALLLAALQQGAGGHGGGSPGACALDRDNKGLLRCCRCCWMLPPMA